MLDKVLWSMRRLGRSRVAREGVRKVFHTIYPHGSVRRIAFGPLRGWRWACHREHQFWMPLGAYERETTQWLVDNIAPGMTFLDIGANAGYFTLLGAKLVGPSGRVVAFEPVPQNIEVLERQIAINDIGAYTSVETAAISDAVGQAEFVIDSVNANSRLEAVNATHTRGVAVATVSVETTTLDRWCEAHQVRPDVIKIDVEGAELEALAGAEHVLAEVRPRLIVSTHSDALRDATQQAI